ncbi:hypothetical protein SAMN05421810_102316 [Amycolatopsis arida]|uniref:Lipase (Class 3) n=1 Tax=Amycolatopsis arida TaxID=587909 RepID=A0A1I5PJN2_9PSEU|nr:hypothetical protein [Amycolatopsis arida]TDX98524.1 hypothetical protein CLV69_101316 [Amycolatopsis arida]SFP34342.1 hypothetical protein SAMN05421810_102316 [Amycolatopsis arida]
MPIPGPDTRVVELRVPGLAGTSGEALLDSAGTVDVAGDGVGRIIRPADRLRRPAPGPVLQALGRALPRTLEGYLWSGMTGGVGKAAWALLFPFSLANVAFWMLPPVPAPATLRGRTAAVVGEACRLLLRVAGLLLTMLLVSQLAVVSLDLLAGQCLARTSGCLDVAPPQLRELEPVRTAVGVLPLLALVLVLHRASGTRWAVTVDEGAPRPGPALPGDELRAARGIPLLRCVHTVAALGTLALMLLGGPAHPPAAMVGRVAWAVALVLVGLSVLAAAVCLERLFGRVARALLLAVAVALVLVAAVLATPLPTALPGTDGTVEGVGAALVLVCVLFAVLLVPAALLARPAWRSLPHRLRPWAGGWLAAPVLLLAALLGGGFGAGLAVALRHLVGGPDIRLPQSYALIMVLWGAGLVLAVVLGAIGFAVAVPLRRRRRGIPEVVRMLQTGERERREAATAWARASWERKYLHRVVLAVALAMAAGAGVLLLVRLGVGTVPSWLDPLYGVGVAALGGLAAGLLRVVYTAATSPERDRHLGAFADLVSFWPRAAHPVVPPSYALKVMPELAARAREHLADPHTRVVLAGYHIGGLLAVIAAGRLVADLPPADRERVGVVTAGAPLQWGYQRAFPAVLPPETLAAVYGSLAGRWRGLCRGTDTFGGGATTWRHQVVAGRLLGIGYLPDGHVGPLAPASRSPTGALVLGGDHWLPDPMRGPVVGRRWVAGVRENADYVVDPEWDRAVAMAAGLEQPGRVPRPVAEQVPLFGDICLGDPPRQEGDSSGLAAAEAQQDENGGAAQHQ